MTKLKSLSLALLMLSAVPVAASDWAVDPAASTLSFEYTEEGKTKTGSFGLWTADITFDPDNLDGASASVKIDITSIDAGSRGNTESALDKEWLNQDDFPGAQFDTTAFRAVGEGAYEADANLTIRDKTNPITLPFTLAFEGDRVTMKGETSFERNAFGVGQGEYATDETIAQPIKVLVDLQADRVAASEGE